MVKYGNFSNRVNWNTCLLELVSPQGKHYLQGDGTLSGMLENIIIFETSPGKYDTNVGLINAVPKYICILPRKLAFIKIMSNQYGAVNVCEEFECNFNSLFFARWHTLLLLMSYRSFVVSLIYSSEF